MSTELLWKTGELYSKIYQSFWTAPAEYNPRTHRLNYCKNPREYRIWTRILYSASAVNFCFYVCLVFRIYKLIVSKQPIPIVTISFSFLGGIVLILDSIAPIFVKYLETVCYVANQGAEIEESYMRIRPDAKSNLKTDYIGISMYAIMAFSPLLSVGCTLMESTTKFLVFGLMSGRTELEIIAVMIVVFRKIFLCLMAFEASRIIFGLLLLLIISEEGTFFLLNQYRLIGERAIEKLNMRLVHYSMNSYNSALILLSISEYILAFVIVALMSGGLAAFVVLMTITLKMHSIIPKPYYYLSPVTAVITLLFISFTLPQAVKVYDLSMSLVRAWKLKAGMSSGYNSRYIRKRMKALRPINIPAGIGTFNLYWINKSIKASYYKALGDFTLDLLIAIPKLGNK